MNVLFAAAAFASPPNLEIIDCVDGQSIPVAAIVDGQVRDLDVPLRAEGLAHRGKIDACDDVHLSVDRAPAVPAPMSPGAALALLKGIDGRFHGFRAGFPFADDTLSQLELIGSAGQRVRWTTSTLVTEVVTTSEPLWWTLEAGEPGSWVGYASTPEGGVVVLVADGSVQIQPVLD